MNCVKTKHSIEEIIKKSRLPCADENAKAVLPVVGTNLGLKIGMTRFVV